jgi:large subunit ribosomal protein L15
MNLSNLTPPEKNKKRSRVGRGESSGLGKTCGKGHKGQKSRSGGTVSPGFEGGQMPLQRRLPKKGFNNPLKVRYQIINLGNLAVLDPSVMITSEVLREKGIVKRKGPIKLLSRGEISAAYNVRVDKVSRAAAEKIQASGGSVED